MSTQSTIRSGSHPAETAQQLDLPVVFFDGVCGLCSRFVDFLLKRDRMGRLRYAPLQGDTAKQLLPLELTENLNSVAFVHHGKVSTQTSAVVRILWQLGLFWKVCASLLWLIPKPLRNIGYHLVAKFRYSLFGKTESCRMPQPGEQERFLN